MSNISLRVMTSNILHPQPHEFDSGKPQARFGLVSFLYHKLSPDIIAVNEYAYGAYKILNPLVSDAYTDCDILIDGPRQEDDIRYKKHMTQIEDRRYFNCNHILYRTDRFDELDKGCYLYEIDKTLEWGGTDGGVPVFRNITWAVLSDRLTGNKLLIMNTHLNPFHNDLFKRIIEAGELVVFAKNTEKKYGAIPVICGDLNAVNGSEPLRCLEYNGFGDSLKNAETVYGEGFKSTHAVGEAPTPGSPYDHILFRDDVRCTLHETVFSTRMLEASDHNFVYADFAM